MGLAEQALGRWIDGEAHLARALEAGQDPWIAKYRGTLESSRAEIGKHLGSLYVTGGPEGAELRLDGQPVGTLPLRRPLRLPLGTFSLEASVGGHVVVARAVSIAAGLTAHEDLSAPAAAPASPAAAPAPVAVSTRESARDEGPPEAASGRRRLAWVAVGGAVALAAAGGVVLFLGNRDARSYNTTCAAGDCAGLSRREGSASMRRRRRRARRGGRARREGRVALPVGADTPERGASRGLRARARPLGRRLRAPLLSAYSMMGAPFDELFAARS